MEEVKTPGSGKAQQRAGSLRGLSSGCFSGCEIVATPLLRLQMLFLYTEHILFMYKGFATVKISGFINYFKFHTKTFSYHKLTFPAARKQLMSSSKRMKEMKPDRNEREQASVWQRKGLSTGSPTVPVPMGIVTQLYLNSRETTANKKYML